MGIMEFCRKLTWMLLRSLTFVPGESTQCERILAALLKLRGLLMTFYSSWNSTHPLSERLTQVNEITPKMVGASSPEDEKFKIKGMEAWGYLQFLLELLERSPQYFGEQPMVDKLFEGGTCLVRFIRVV